MKTLSFPILLSVMFLALNACGGGSSPTPTQQVLSKVGFDLPSEVSAVPTTANGSSPKPGLLSKMMALSAATDPTTDYSKATTVRHIAEHELEQAQIIGQILTWLAQTHYADEVNINKGPYIALVSMEEEENGVAVKRVESWVVDSKILLEGGKEVNRVQIWIDDADEETGAPTTFKVEFKIFAAATKKSDGSYKDYGVWTVHAKGGGQGLDTFVADIGVGSSGETIIKINESFDGREVKIILNRSNSNGFGKIRFPDYSSCTSPDCIPTASINSVYAYNATHLGIKKGTSPPVFKDRTKFTELTHRYGLFDGVTGEDLLRKKSFGFPVEFTTGTSSIRHHGFYGAWQGRHDLWAGDTAVLAGTVVTRQRYGAGTNTTPETYTVSPEFKGILTKRSLIPASGNDLLGIPVETYFDRNMVLRHDGTNFIDCRNMTFVNPSPTCGEGSATFTDLISLLIDPKDEFGKRVNIGGMGKQYVYLKPGPSGEGFYEATFDQTTGELTPISPSTKLTPVSGTQLFVHIGGRVYIEFTATGWVEKVLLSFDQRTWTPKFDDTKNKPFIPELNREYYIHTRGANFVVKRIDDIPTYDIKIEIQAAANPANAAGLILPGTVLKPEWADNGNSTFEFIINSADPKFLKLVYKTVGTRDQGAVVGAVVEKGMWGLVETVGTAPSRFNWEFPQGDQHWGSQQFLIKNDGGYKILDDPIALKPIAILNNAGISKNLSLQFDGWMHGLPDLFFELRENDFLISKDIADKVINIPDATILEDATVAGKTYLVRPLMVSQFLTVVPDPGILSFAGADATDLATVPNFVDPNMGPTPTATLKYIEGVNVQP